MQLDFDSERALFRQVSHAIEDNILSGAYAEGAKIPSIRELAASYTINSATVQRGVTLLLDKGVLFTKRGRGVFVSDHAYEMLRDKRLWQFHDDFIIGMMKEAKRLRLTKDDIITLLSNGVEEKEAES